MSRALVAKRRHFLAGIAGACSCIGTSKSSFARPIGMLTSTTGLGSIIQSKPAIRFVWEEDGVILEPQSPACLVMHFPEDQVRALNIGARKIILIVERRGDWQIKLLQDRSEARLVDVARRQQTHVKLSVQGVQIEEIRVSGQLRASETRYGWSQELPGVYHEIEQARLESVSLLPTKTLPSV